MYYKFSLFLMFIVYFTPPDEHPTTQNRSLSVLFSDVPRELRTVSNTQQALNVYLCWMDKSSGQFCALCLWDFTCLTGKPTSSSSQYKQAIHELVRCVALTRICYGNSHWKLAEAHVNLAQGYLQLKGEFLSDWGGSVSWFLLFPKFGSHLARRIRFSWISSSPHIDKLSPFRKSH